MTLLEDARRLAELAVPMWEERFNDSGVCPHCGEYRKHASDCAMRALPRIVAVLEAAERVAQLAYTTVYAEDYTGASWLACRECGACDGAHTDDCPWQPFVFALEGEVMA